MYYSLEELFSQACQDNLATNLDSPTYEARLVYGCKIIKERENGKITIQNTTKGGDFYEDVSDFELGSFLDRGFRYGVYVVALENYKRKLVTIERSIRREMNGRQNPKIITSLKSHRERILNKYNLITQKLNNE